MPLQQKIMKPVIETISYKNAIYDGAQSTTPNCGSGHDDMQLAQEQKSSQIKIADKNDRASRKSNRKWLVFVSAIICHACVPGACVSVGLLFVEVIEAFDENRATVGWMASLCIGMLYGSGVVAAKICDTLGTKYTAILGSLLGTAGLTCSFFASSVYWLYGTIGIALGFGGSMVLMSDFVAVSMWFDKGRPIVLSVIACSDAGGALIYPAFMAYINTIYGWRGGLFIWAGVAFQAVIFSCFLGPPEQTSGDRTEIRPHQNEAFESTINADYIRQSPTTKTIEDSEYMQSETNQRKSNSEKLQLQGSSFPQHCEENVDLPSKATSSHTPTFWIVLCKSWTIPVTLISVFIVGMCILGIYTIIVDVIMSKGLDTQSAAPYLTYLSITVSGIMPLIGILIRVTRFTALDGLIVSAVSLSVLVTLFPYSTAQLEYTIMVLIIGVAIGIDGTTITLVPLQLVDIDEGGSTAVGMFQSAMGLGGIVGTPIIGVLRDIMGDYNLPLQLMALPLALSAILFLVVRLHQICCSNTKHATAKAELEIVP